MKLKLVDKIGGRDDVFESVVNKIKAGDIETGVSLSKEYTDLVLELDGINNLFKNIKTKISISHRCSSTERTCGTYSFKNKEVKILHPSAFKSLYDFYFTLFHELVHSVDDINEIYNRSLAETELIADIGAYLCLTAFGEFKYNPVVLRSDFVGDGEFFDIDFFTDDCNFDFEDIFGVSYELVSSLFDMGLFSFIPCVDSLRVFI